MKTYAVAICFMNDVDLIVEVKEAPTWREAVLLHSLCPWIENYTGKVYTAPVDDMPYDLEKAKVEITDFDMALDVKELISVFDGHVGGSSIEGRGVE